MADPAVRRVQRGQRDAGDRGRQRERQIDQGIDERLPGNRSAPAPTRRPAPNTTLISAAASEAPKLSLYEASTRGDVTAPELLPVSAAVFRNAADSGISTMRLRYRSV